MELLRYVQQSPSAETATSETLNKTKREIRAAADGESETPISSSDTQQKAPNGHGREAPVEESGAQMTGTDPRVASAKLAATITCSGVVVARVSCIRWAWLM